MVSEASLADLRCPPGPFRLMGSRHVSLRAAKAFEAGQARLTEAR